MFSVVHYADELRETNFMWECGGDLLKAQFILNLVIGRGVPKVQILKACLCVSVLVCVFVCMCVCVEYSGQSGLRVLNTTVHVRSSLLWYVNAVC
jgi:hypothetical protein